MLTGAYPTATGIVANEWPDRDSIKKVSSVSDENAKLLGSDLIEEAASPGVC